MGRDICHGDALLCGDANESMLHLDAGHRVLDQSTIRTNRRYVCGAVRRLYVEGRLSVPVHMADCARD